MERSMSKPVDLKKSLAALDQDSTLIVVIEMSQSSWLVAARAPGLARDPLKKLAPDSEQLLKLINRWREESRRAGRVVRRVCVAFEAGRNGFWLARLLRQHDIEAYVIHPTSIPVKRDHRRAKTDRLDTALLMRAFLGWLRGEADHCSMAAIPTLEEEDGKRPTREHESRVKTRSRIVNRMKGALARLGIQGFNRNCARRPRSSNSCAPERASRCRPTPWPSCGATWRNCASSPIRSSRSRRRARRGSKRPPMEACTRWSVCWRASRASASKRRRCWWRKSFRATCATGAPWLATAA